MTALQNFESLLPFATTAFACFLGDDDTGRRSIDLHRCSSERGGLDFVYAQEWISQ